jgi:hypothetical protein
VLDDDAADFCAPSPTTLAWRRLLRVTAAGAVVTLLLVFASALLATRLPER